jgi:hypothetical protein
MMKRFQMNRKALRNIRVLQDQAWVSFSIRGILLQVKIRFNLTVACFLRKIKYLRINDYFIIYYSLLNSVFINNVFYYRNIKTIQQIY